MHQQKVADAGQHDELPPAGLADVVQAAGADGQARQQQREYDDAIKPVGDQ